MTNKVTRCRGCEAMVLPSQTFCDTCQITGSLSRNHHSENKADNHSQPVPTPKLELSGNDVNYYIVGIPNPKRLPPCKVECEDLIEALGMTFAEGTILKALFRSCNLRQHGLGKQGQENDGGVYDGDKIAYYGKRVKVQRRRQAGKPEE